MVSAIYFNSYLLSSPDTAPLENKNLDFDWKIRRLSSEFPGRQQLLSERPSRNDTKVRMGFVDRNRLQSLSTIIAIP